MPTDSQTVRRIVQFKFTLPTANSSHLAALVKAAACTAARRNDFPGAPQDQAPGCLSTPNKCLDSEVRIIVQHARSRTSESKDTSNLLIQCGLGSEVRMSDSLQE